jgi:hypothetical protein
MSIKRRIEAMEKILAAESFSAIPRAERVVWAKGHTQEEREIQMAEKVAALHTKYGAFNDDSLFKVYIRLFCRGRINT